MNNMSHEELNDVLDVALVSQTIIIGNTMGNMITKQEAEEIKEWLKSYNRNILKRVQKALRLEIDELEANDKIEQSLMINQWICHISQMIEDKG